MNNPIGIMQGRLLPPVQGLIQAFPEEEWEKEFSSASELGIDCIEFIFGGDNPESHPLMNIKGIERINSLEKQTGVRVLSVCADYFMDYPLHRGDGRKALGVLNALIRNCGILSVKDIIIPCVDRSGLKTLEEIRQLEVSLKKSFPLAEKLGINLTLETDLPPEGFIGLLRRFSSPNIKVNYDMGNSASLGYDPEEELDIYGRWITDVHIKDRTYKGGSVPLGEGDVNFHLVFSKLKRLGFSGIFILQTARGQTGREKEKIKDYLSFLKRFIGGGKGSKWN
ncbi:MAG: sugar phosphate isomerase/epimerase [Nitrospirae bacterium]|nr:sugar phosphate isomerase/epimerase [Nitrospirota bacterium]